MPPYSYSIPSDLKIPVHSDRIPDMHLNFCRQNYSLGGAFRADSICDVENRQQQPLEHNIT